MSVISVHIADVYLQNKIFAIDDKKLNRDNFMLPYWLLRESMQKEGHSFNTFDLHKDKKSDIRIFIDRIDVPNDDSLKVLLLLECEVILPENWTKKAHDKFDIIFTWHDKYVDNKKYFKFNFPQVVPSKNYSFPRQNRFCIIAGNKKRVHPLELYSKRVEIIEWFQKNAPADLDLYGPDWDKHTFSGPKIFRAFNRIPQLRKALGRKYTFYKGMCDSKHEVLSKYDFCVCFENAKEIDGYITEKIFDCFFTGTIPIYWGPKNITTHIPQNCFIPFTKFSSIEQMYKELKNMSVEEKEAYRQNIKNFLMSSAYEQFSTEFFVKTIKSKIDNK